MSPTERVIGIVTGDIRQVRFADIWVNSENTDMVMARCQEFSISAIVRYDGAIRNEAGRVVVDQIFDDLNMRVGAQRPVAPGTTVVTTAGELRGSNGVRHLIHVAAVHGEPGVGFRPVIDVGRCVQHAIMSAVQIRQVDPDSTTVLIPLLGTGTAGAEPAAIAATLLEPAIHHVIAAPSPAMERIFFLTSTTEELRACRAVLDTDERLRCIDTEVMPTRPARRSEA